MDWLMCVPLLYFNFRQCTFLEQFYTWWLKARRRYPVLKSQLIKRGVRSGIDKGMEGLHYEVHRQYHPTEARLQIIQSNMRAHRTEIARHCQSSVRAINDKGFGKLGFNNVHIKEKLRLILDHGHIRQYHNSFCMLLYMLVRNHVQNTIILLLSCQCEKTEFKG